MPPPLPEELEQLLPAGAYTVEALLGQGGMGAVYRGTQVRLDRPVAIKILSQEVTDDEVNYAERFRNEARLMARLSHPGIVSLIDFGETSAGQLFMVLEFIEGSDVARLLDERPILPPQEALSIAAHVCDALEYAHVRGVIHRDIKPANVMLDVQGRVKVADFGLAKLTAGSGGLTLTNMVMGTPDYIAPETFLGMSLADHRADVFAVGVMLYRMVTGGVPRGSYVKPSDKVPGLDPRLDDLIGRAMEEERELRYQSAADLRTAIDQLLAGERRVAATREEPAAGHAGTRRSGKQAAPARAGRDIPWMTIGMVAFALVILGIFGFLRLRKTEAVKAPAVAVAVVEQTTPPAPAPAPAAPAVSAAPAPPPPPVAKPEAVPAASSPAPTPAAAPAVMGAAAPQAPATMTPAPAPAVMVETPQPVPAPVPAEPDILLDGAKATEVAKYTVGNVERETLAPATPGLGTGEGQILHWSGFQVGDTLLVPVEVPKQGNYRLEGRLVRGAQMVPIQVITGGGAVARDVSGLDSPDIALTPYLNWGVHALSSGPQPITFRALAADPGKGEGGLKLESLRLIPTTQRETGPQSAAVRLSTQGAAPAVVLELEKLVKGCEFQTGTLWFLKDKNYLPMSGGESREWRDFEKGGRISWKLPVSRPGTYRVYAGLTVSTQDVSTPVLSASLAGKEVVSAKQIMARRNSTYRLMPLWDLGMATLEDGVELAFTVNERSKGNNHSIQFDAVYLEPEMPDVLPVSAPMTTPDSATFVWVNADGFPIPGRFGRMESSGARLYLGGKQIYSAIPMSKMSLQYAADLAAAMEKRTPPPVSDFVFQGRIEGGAIIRISTTLSLHADGGANPEALTVNGRPWQPAWSGKDTEPLKLPAGWRSMEVGRLIEVTKLSGRGFVDILEEPSVENGATLVIRVTDHGDGADTYSLRIRW